MSISGGRYLSKGKWIPGMKPSDSQSGYYCDICDRGFVSDNNLQKHFASELHFKRKAKENGSNLQKNDELFDDTVFARSMHVGKRRNTVSTIRIDKNGQQIIQCPTCFSNVDKLLMGKHLISYFHCQKVTKKDRRTDPEMKLILEYIPQISLQSPFQCGPCKYYFTQREQLQQHFEEFHIKLEEKFWSKRNILNRWRCSSCPELLANDESEMLNHLISPGHRKMEAALSKSIPIILRKICLQSCLLCTKSFVLNRELSSHISKVHQNAVYTSDIKRRISVDLQLPSKCETTESDGHLSQPIEQNVTGCNICGAVFSRISSLNRHKAHAHGTQMSGIYKCEVCNYKTRKSSHFQRHSKQHFTDREKSFQCEICTAKFFEVYALDHHKKIHFKKTVPCNYPGCKFMGRNLSEVEAHNLRHTNDRKFNCDECSYTCKSQFSLRRHIKLSHCSDETKEYSCKQCSYSSKLYNCLKRHELQHNDGKSFHCPHCNFSSKTLENLRIHVVRRKIHMGRFLYNCGECQPASLEKRVFATNSFSDFKNHMTESHFAEPFVKTDLELLIIAGIKKQETTDSTAVVKKQNSAPPQICELVNENPQSIDMENDLNVVKKLCFQDSNGNSKSYVVNSSSDENFNNNCATHKSEIEFSNDLPVDDNIFINELYDNLLIVSDEELQFANVKNDI